MSIFLQRPGLLSQFRLGHSDAFECIYRQHHEDVVWLAKRGFWSHGFRVTGLQSHSSDVADVAQSVFVRIWTPSVRASFDESRPFRPFLMTIARRTLVDWHRRTMREIPTAPAPLALSMEKGNPRTCEATDDAWLRSLARRYVDGLPDHLSRIHEQRFVLDTSQQTAARALGLTRQRVRTLENQLLSGLRCPSMNSVDSVA